MFESRYLNLKLLTVLLWRSRFLRTLILFFIVPGRDVWNRFSADRDAESDEIVWPSYFFCCFNENFE